MSKENNYFRLVGEVIQTGITKYNTYWVLLSINDRTYIVDCKDLIEVERLSKGDIAEIEGFVKSVNKKLGLIATKIRITGMAESKPKPQHEPQEDDIPF